MQVIHTIRHSFSEQAENKLYSVDWFIDRMATMFNISGKRDKIPTWFILRVLATEHIVFSSLGDLTVCAIVGDKVTKDLEAKGVLEEDGNGKDGSAWSPANS